MNDRWILAAFVLLGAVLGAGVATAQLCPPCPEEQSISGAENLSDQAPTVVVNCPCNEVLLVWGGDGTLTVNETPTFRVAGIDADGNAATIAFGVNSFKVRLKNSAGNVVIQDGGGSITVTGTNASAGFSTTQETGDTVEIRSPIAGAVNANHWFIGNNTLWLKEPSASIRDLDIGGGSSAILDVDEAATINSITPAGDFTVDIASGKTLTLSTALDVGSNTMTVSGGSATKTLNVTDGIDLNSATSVLSILRDVTIDDVDIDAAGALLDINQSCTITNVALAANGTVDVAGGKTLTATNGVDTNGNTLTLSNTGTISKVDIDGAGGTVKLTAASATITNLTHTAAGTIDLDKDTCNLTVTNDIVTGNRKLILQGSGGGTAEKLTATVDLSGGAGAELEVTGNDLDNIVVTEIDVSVNAATVDANIDFSPTLIDMNAGLGDLTLEIGANTLTTNIDVNDNTLTITETGAGTISTVTMDTGGGVVDLNTGKTITNLNVTLTSGIATFHNGASSGGTVTVSGAGGTLQVDESAAIADIDVTGAATVSFIKGVSVTSLDISANATISVGGSETLTTTATVNGSNKMAFSGPGTITTVTLSGNKAELNSTFNCAINTLNITVNGAIIDVDADCTFNTINMTSGAGDTTLEVKAGKTLTATFDVNNNKLVLAESGVPGTITMDTAGGILDVDDDCTPTALTISANVTVDVAAGKTLTATHNIGTHTLTLAGPGTITRIDTSTGKVVNNGGTTINDLRPTYGLGGTFTYGGTGDSTVVSMADGLPGNGETFKKIDGGALTLTEGFSTAFANGMSVKLDIDGGEMILGAPGSNDDITFNDDGDEITVANGASVTTFGSITVGAPGSNVNLDAVAGSTVNLSSSSGVENFTAAADNDFQLLGTVNIDGTNGIYMLAGAFDHQFGTVNIGSNGALINNTPSSGMLFVPNSVVTLEGSGSGKLIIDGQDPDTPITVSTTTGSGTFTINRAESKDLTVQNVVLSNAAYTSADGGTAVAEIALTNVIDGGNNANWFTPAEVILPEEDNDNENDNGKENDNGSENDTDNGGGVTPPSEHPGFVVEVDADGDASAAATSSETGAFARADVSGAAGGTVQVTVVDGNTQADLTGIPQDFALPVTMRVNDELDGDFIAVLQLCITEDMLEDADVSLGELALYRYQEPNGPWSLAGQEDQDKGDTDPSGVVGDFGIITETVCLWAVVDDLSDFTAGLASSTGADGGAVDGGGANGGDACGAPLCGAAGMGQLTLMFLGLGALRFHARRNRTTTAK